MRHVAAVIGVCIGVTGSGCGSAQPSPASPSNTNGFTVAGTVTEAPPGFSPLADARIEIVAGSNLHGVARTDASGAYTFGTLPKGNYTFDVTRQGYIETTKSISLNRNMSVSVLLYPVPPPNATARCKDKSWSYVQDKAAACVPHNGGVAYFVCPGLLCPSGSGTD